MPIPRGIRIPKYKPRVSKRQKLAVDAIIRGEASNVKEAMLKAGYKLNTAREPANLTQRSGVIAYLETLNKMAIKQWGVSVPDKIGEVMLNGLEADKPYGKEGFLHADWMARHKFAESLSKFFGLLDSHSESDRPTQNQFNFFSVPKDEQHKFNANFNEFIKKFYNKE